jgi:hypothetical protein
MSQKAFYQTFYQTETLFRLPDDPLSFGLSALAHAESPTARLPVGVPSALPVPVVSVPMVVPVVTVPTVKPVEVVPSDAELPVSPPTDGVTAGADEQPPGLVLPPTAEKPTPDAGATDKPAVGHTSVDSPPESLRDAPAGVPVPMTIGGQELGPVTRPLVPTPARPVLKPVPVLAHRVLIAVADVPLPGEVLFLQNVLKAVHLDADSVDLLTLTTWTDKDFRPVLADRQVDQFIIFGLSFSELGLDIDMDLYHPVRFNGITFMRADAPGLIETDRALKKRLWESLQRIFLRPRPQ